MKRIVVVVALFVLLGAAEADAAPPAITAIASPASPLFGDTVAYVVNARVDASAFDGARVLDPVLPFTRIAPTRVTRTVVNGVGQITVTETIACLSARCVAGRRGAAIALPAARVVAGGAVAVAPRVEVQVGSRVTDAAVKAAAPSFRHPAGLPRPTSRVSPAAEALLALLGVALVAIGVVVLTAPLHRTRSAAPRAELSDPRERAARLLRESAGRHPSDRRRAASLASRVVGESDLAVEAAGVAWSRSEPRAPDAVTLAERVERTGAGARE